LAPEPHLNGTSEATGVILAGGESRRMGRDKLPLIVGGKPLLDGVCLILASHCDEILVVGEGGYAPAGARCIPDLRPGRQGPLAGIEAGLLAARHRAVFVAAGDMPFLTGDLAGYLLGLLSDDVPAVVPDSGSQLHPLCAAYGREVRPAVSVALDRGIRSVRELLEAMPNVRYVHEEELRRFGDPDLLLTNVNSPKDLERARKALDSGEG
jgi:molybdopterin-guanine dinucleotide biosynthesis protein A